MVKGGLQSANSHEGRGFRAVLEPLPYSVIRATVGAARDSGPSATEWLRGIWLQCGSRSGSPTGRPKRHRKRVSISQRQTADLIVKYGLEFLLFRISAASILIPPPRATIISELIRAPLTLPFITAA
jgi:hypothetical protein